MATETYLVERLKREAQIQDEESPFVEDSYALLKTIVSSALFTHNKLLKPELLPQQEEALIMLLGRSQVALFRAQKHADDRNVSGASGYGTDRNTPYYKNIDLAKKLKEEYDEMASSMGLSPVASSMPTVQVSSLRIFDPKVGGVVPSSTDYPPQPALSVESADIFSKWIILSWQFPYYRNFKRYYVISMEVDETGNVEVVTGTTAPESFVTGEVNILQPWITEKRNGVPGINPLATITALTFAQTTKSYKVSDLDDAKTYRYVIAVESGYGLFSFSNELVFEFPDVEIVTGQSDGSEPIVGA